MNRCHHRCQPGVITRWQQTGFSLLEVVVAMGIVAIGFVGVYGLVGLSDRALQETVDREQMVMRAGQILEEIGNEMVVNANSQLASFNKDLMQTNCNTLTDANAVIERRLRQWCERLNDYLGPPDGMQPNNQRRIFVTNQPNVRLVKVTLSTKNGGSQVSVVRRFNVPAP
ncbi:MAG: prepilin-type N-terminal cleavage/methylation domain-containing protein [Arenicellales bacterium]|nr:prepilin-type N-terminal cleavage/methylation domain-containing protein [Arenicellales bacterium]MDP6289148.1 prepilin-type N-terminal cleavage/methylation domain-containing protein [Arenicellales bacterium]MDP7156377.1 prepilin-type N-terminal cleavage/methylation domain-containing protein [Arenicellales bacterium]MDP7282790.1 prepilin-type N-terminal cleavage/methylation domain-containing protein [Arenicellales bacterium]MDP7482454.1 prepilin-type N-terminal cleavage/methylation domain-con